MAQYVPPANIRTLTYTTPGVVIHYPQVSGLANPRAQEAINQRILLQLHEMERMQQQVQTGTNPQTTVTFEIKTNERGILSLVLTNYTYSEHMAHGYTIAKGLTFNIANGHAYALHELFRPGSNYQAVLTAEVQRQLQERNLPVLEDSDATVSSDQDFYLADKALVIFYPLYAITPYYVGIPMFPISVYDLQDIATENGPISLLSANIA
ncbi:hypothetical protein JCM10914A_30430 [Paenibacillus sp. JCM 10914]